jgi:hypothetical protein
MRRRPIILVIAAAYLARRGDLAAGTLAVGLYLLLVAPAIGTAFPLWLPHDNTILGSALLAGLIAGVGTGLTLVGAGGLGGRSRTVPNTIGLTAAILASLAVTAGGAVSPLARLHLPVVVGVLVALRVTRVLRPRRRLPWRPLARSSPSRRSSLVARGTGRPARPRSSPTASRWWCWPSRSATLPLVRHTGVSHRRASLTGRAAGGYRRRGFAALRSVRQRRGDRSPTPRVSRRSGSGQGAPAYGAPPNGW